MGTQLSRALRPRWFDELGLLIALVAMVGVVAVFHPAFIQVASLSNLGQQASYYGIIAIGMVFLLSMSEIDLSVGSIYGFTAVASAVLIERGLDPWLAAGAAVLFGAALGAVNGSLANVLRIQTIIVTLGTMQAIFGLTLIVSGGRTVADLPFDHPFFVHLGGELLGIPVIVWAFVALTVVFTFVYKRTRYGFLVRAVGSNRQAAVLSGIPVARLRLVTLILAGALCGVAGAFTLAFFAAADPNVGRGYELLAIASAIIGGTALEGGSGTVFGAFLGALMIAVIQNGLIQFGIEANWSFFVTGALIIAAVALDALIRRRRGQPRSASAALGLLRRMRRRQKRPNSPDVDESDTEVQQSNKRESS